MEPIISVQGKIIRIEDPENAERRTKDLRVVYLLVSEDGYCGLHDWSWDGKRPNRGGYKHTPEDIELMRTMREEIWPWLVEHELVELKPIGPEDSEYFATDKLLKY